MLCISEIFFDNTRINKEAFKAAEEKSDNTKILVNDRFNIDIFLLNSFKFFQYEK